MRALGEQVAQHNYVMGMVGADDGTGAGREIVEINEGPVQVKHIRKGGGVNKSYEANVLRDPREKVVKARAPPPPPTAKGGFLKKMGM